MVQVLDAITHIKVCLRNHMMYIYKKKKKTAVQNHTKPQRLISYYGTKETKFHIFDNVKASDDLTSSCVCLCRSAVRFAGVNNLIQLTWCLAQADATIPSFWRHCLVNAGREVRKQLTSDSRYLQCEIDTLKITAKCERPPVRQTTRIVTSNSIDNYLMNII